jgi:hypothetical protein
MSGSYDYHQQLESSLMEFAGIEPRIPCTHHARKKTSLTIQSIDRDVSAIHLSIIEKCQGQEPLRNCRPQNCRNLSMPLQPIKKIERGGFAQCFKTRGTKKSLGLMLALEDLAPLLDSPHIRLLL